MTEWISITDKLPKAYEDILVYAKMKDKQDDYVVVAYLHEKRFHQNPYLLLVGTVTHWMPLPESPHRKSK